MTLRLIVAEDHPLVRAGLQRALPRYSIHIVTSVDSPREIVRSVDRHRPDALLSDLLFPHGNALSVIRDVRTSHPGMAIVVLSASSNPTFVARAMISGAQDYVSKEAPIDDVVAAIRSAYLRTPPPATSVMRRVTQCLRDPARVQRNGLEFTRRGSQVLRHLAFGLGNQEIADSLQISVDTVKEHVQNVLRQLKIRDRTRAALWALQHGLGPPNGEL